MLKMDAYTFHARALPSIATWFPAWVSCAVGTVESSMIERVGGQLVSITVPAVVVAWMAMTVQQGARAGKALEPKLWESWGGKPTTRMLRHRDTSLDYARKAKLHKWMGAEGFMVPTERDDEQRPKWSDEQWDIAVTKMRTLMLGDTRVEGKNRRYGYYRNLYGMQRKGWIVGMLSLGGAGTMAWLTICGDGSVLNGYTAAVGVVIAWMGWWAAECRETNVKDAADEYAKELFECMLGTI